MITSRIEGHVIGETWGNERCFVPITISLLPAHRKGRSFYEKVKASLRERGQSDFQGPLLLTADSTLVTESCRGRTGTRGYTQVTKTRYINVLELPSIGDLVDDQFDVIERIM